MISPSPIPLAPPPPPAPLPSPLRPPPLPSPPASFSSSSAFYVFGLFLRTTFKESDLGADSFYNPKSLCVCASVRFLRYHLNVFLPTLPKVKCPSLLDFQNPSGKVMQRSGLRFEHFCFEVVQICPYIFFCSLKTSDQRAYRQYWHTSKHFSFQ